MPKKIFQKFDTGNKKIITFAAHFAQMAELVDALVSGTSVSNDVQVRVLFWAQTNLFIRVHQLDVCLVCRI